MLVVIDGLKSDILTANSSIVIPNLEGIINGDGIYVKDITPEFPALRLPFLTSLVTWRHSQEHGVLGNEVYDEVSEKIWKVEEDGDLFWEKAKQMKNVWVWNWKVLRVETYERQSKSDITIYELY